MKKTKKNIIKLTPLASLDQFKEEKKKITMQTKID
jgi:hypothetical protein